MRTILISFAYLFAIHANAQSNVDWENFINHLMDDISQEQVQGFIVNGGLIYKNSIFTKGIETKTYESKTNLSELSNESIKFTLYEPSSSTNETAKITITTSNASSILKLKKTLKANLIEFGKFIIDQEMGSCFEYNTRQEKSNNQIKKTTILNAVCKEYNSNGRLTLKIDITITVIPA
jgi:hypothetical protein